MFELLGKHVFGALRRCLILSLEARASTRLVVVVLAISMAEIAPGNAQTEAPLRIAVGTHAMTVPWYLPPVTNRLNPAVLVGTDVPMKSGDSWRLLLAVNVGFFRHHWWMTGFSIEPEVGIGRSLPAGFFADLRLGVGYLHYFWRRKRMKLDEGRYVDAEGFGNPSVILPLSVSLGYRGRGNQPISVSPFVTARWGIQGLFVEKVPVMTHLQLLGGVRLTQTQDSVDGGM